MDIFQILDQAHQALRAIDAADFAVPEKEMGKVCDAIAAIERGRVALGYKLSELDRSRGRG